MNARPSYYFSLVGLGAAACFFAVQPAPAQGTKPPGFDDFKMVKNRNIFDPNRRATRTENSERDPRVSERRITRANTLSLTGTLVSDGRPLAFFSGSRSEYSKVVRVGDSVADHKVEAITPNLVRLERGGKVTELAVGKLLALEGTTEIVTEPAPGAETPADAPPAGALAAPTDPAAAATAAPPSPPSNDKNEVLRRMMERRSKEMNK